jgi:hypothetical protein
MGRMHVVNTDVQAGDVVRVQAEVVAIWRSIHVRVLVGCAAATNSWLRLPRILWALIDAVWHVVTIGVHLGHIAATKADDCFVDVQWAIVEAIHLAITVGVQRRLCAAAPRQGTQARYLCVMPGVGEPR